MAKTYIDIVKYMVEARFEILGLAEKPDIIGAVIFIKLPFRVLNLASMRKKSI